MHTSTLLLLPKDCMFTTMYFKCENFHTESGCMNSHNLHLNISLVLKAVHHALRWDMHSSVTKSRSMIAHVWNSHMLKKQQLWCVFSVGVSLLDTTTILNGTVPCTYLRHVWISSSLEVCHYCLMSSSSCHIQGSSLMAKKQQNSTTKTNTRWLTSGQGQF